MVWSLAFGDDATAKKTVDHILSYMRSSPTWIYNGGSRSWGDVGNNGKWLVTYGTTVTDRGQMHYRSGLNMIPLIEWCVDSLEPLFALPKTLYSAPIAFCASQVPDAPGRDLPARGLDGRPCGAARQH